MHIKCAHRKHLRTFIVGFSGWPTIKIYPKRNKNKSWLGWAGRAHSCSLVHFVVAKPHLQSTQWKRDISYRAVQVEIALRWVSIELAIVVPHFWLEIFPHLAKKTKQKSSTKWNLYFHSNFPFSTLCSCCCCCISITNWIRFYAK